MIHLLYCLSFGRPLLFVVLFAKPLARARLQDLA